MKLYHGTNATSAYSIFNDGIDLSKSMLYLDFGQGFYTTDDKNKAIKRARNKTALFFARPFCIKLQKLFVGRCNYIL